jgi:hypothetical protein
MGLVGQRVAGALRAEESSARAVDCQEGISLFLRITPVVGLIHCHFLQLVI